MNESVVARANPKKTVHAFDTFEGITNADPKHDVHLNGDLSDVDAVESVARLDASGVTVHKGYFPTTVKGIDRRFCFAHYDGDTYQTCVDFLAYFWPRMSVGGIMTFDDWQWHRCPGVEKAVREHCDTFGCWPYHTAQCQVAIHRV